MTRNAGARLPIEGLHIPRPSFGDFSVRKRYSKWCANVDPALFQKAGSAESGDPRGKKQYFRTYKNLSPGILRFQAVAQVLSLPAGMIALQTRKEAIRRASASVR